MRESSIVKASSVLRPQVAMRNNRRLPAPLKLLPLLDFEKNSFIAPEDYSSTDVPGTIAARDHLCKISPQDQRGWLSVPPPVDARTFENWAQPGVDDRTDKKSQGIVDYLHNDASPDRASTCHLSPDPHPSELNYELSIVSSDEEVFLPDNDHSDMSLPSEAQTSLAPQNAQSPELGSQPRCKFHKRTPSKTVEKTGRTKQRWL
ncbi:uncharacterized protein DEA37_0014121 [Paragonimus westermani]|uniref:Uncharacterized protein n=1 Tax=Paragonimus westermani TaxID=34504 RepID=A0A5J4N8H7_9TREM|nr:uncharacterized protein DEA37_0014121 [Paragonimus westermani]